MVKADALTFLDLPDEARQSVYALAGLSRPCLIDLLARRPRPATRPRGSGSRSSCSYWLLKRRDGFRSTRVPSGPICACPRLPLALLYVCRRVHDEALGVLLRNNCFVLRARAGCPEMLAPLAVRIPEAQLARVTSLVVRLNCWPCPWGHDDSSTHCSLCFAPTKEADPTLSRSLSADLRMLDAWELVCARLGSGLRPRQLDLTLICDIDPADDGSVTSRLLDPLKCYLPLLKLCTLRLGRASKDRHLTRIARQAALDLVGVAEPSLSTNKPFPFNQLPWELKIRVLRYTHLGPPGLAGYESRLETLDIFHGRLLERPLTFALSRDTTKCCDRCTGTFLDCCCSNTYAAFSPTCACRTLPSALFYVSSDMRRAAIEAFYPDAYLRLRHHNLGAILRVLPLAALPLLRRITIALTPAQCYYWFGRAPDRPHPEWHLRAIAESDWPKGQLCDMPPADADRYRADLRAALARLAAEASLARLELELDLQAVYDFSRLFEGDGDPDDEEAFRWTYALYVDLAELVCAELPGLKSLRFRLATFADLEPWLVREVLGDRFVGSVEPSRGLRRPLSERVPLYHQVGQRLKGSHYHGDEKIKKG